MKTWVYMLVGWVSLSGCAMMNSGQSELRRKHKHTSITVKLPPDVKVIHGDSRGHGHYKDKALK